MGSLNMQINMQKPDTKIQQKRLLLIGDTGIGKRRFIERLLTNKDISAIRVEKGGTMKEDICLDFYVFQNKIQNKKVLKVYLASLSTYHIKKRAIYQNINGVIFTYESDNRDSFDNVKQCIKDLQLFADLQIIKFLVSVNNLPSFLGKSESQLQQRKLAIYYGLHDYGEVNIISDSTFFDVWIRMLSQVQTNEQCKIPFDYSFTLLLMGRPLCGKSKFFQSLVHKVYDERSYPTCYIEYVNLKRNIGDYRLRITIFDNSGARRYWSIIHKTFVPKADGIMLLYDLTDSKNETNQLQLQMLAEQIDKHTTNVPVVLIGNKTDLIQGQYQINPTIRVLAQKYKHFDCSAKRRQNVDEALNALLEQLIERNKEKIQTNRKKRQQQIQHSKNFSQKAT